MTEKKANESGIEIVEPPKEEMFLRVGETKQFRYTLINRCGFPVIAIHTEVKANMPKVLVVREPKELKVSEEADVILQCSCSMGAQPTEPLRLHLEVTGTKVIS